MTVDVTFQIDGRDGIKTVEVRWPHDSAAEASDKLDRMFGSGDSMMRVRDNETDSYVFVNTMKLANVVIEETNE